MKRHILAGISMVALAAALQPAAAADLPVAYRAPQNYVIFTWTGFYFGAHGGGAWGRKDAAIAPFVFGGALVGPPGTNIDISGGLAGGQIGANYQAGSWVFGVEADASWADLTGNTACVTGIVGVAANCRAKVDALGTFAGRLGFALDRVLFYGKGGTAFANDKYELNSIAAYRANETRWGWMVGRRHRIFLHRQLVRQDRVQLPRLRQPRGALHGHDRLLRPRHQHPRAHPRRQSRHQLSLRVGAGRRHLLRRRDNAHASGGTTEPSTRVSALGLSGLAR